MAAVSLRCSLFTDTDGLSGRAPGDAPEAGTATDGPVPVGDTGADAPVPIEVFVKGEDGVGMLAAGPDTLFWVTRVPNGHVASCPFSGCAQPKEIAKGTLAAPDLLVWGKRPLWTLANVKTLFFTEDTGGVSQLAIYQPLSWLTSDGARVFGIEGQNGGGPLFVQGDPPFSTTSFLGFSTVALRIANDPNAVAWTTTDGSVCLCGGNNCTEQNTVVAQNQSPVAIALDANGVFWTTTDGKLRALRRTGSTVDTQVLELASGLAEATSLALDPLGPMIYFTARGTQLASYRDGVVGKVSRTGGAVTMIATAQARPESVVLGGKHVYWATGLDGTIRRVPK